MKVSGWNALLGSPMWATLPTILLSAHAPRFLTDRRLGSVPVLHKRHFMIGPHRLDHGKRDLGRHPTVRTVLCATKVLALELAGWYSHRLDPDQRGVVAEIGE